MQPKSSKHLIKPTAEEIGCDPQMVEDVVNFFYSEVRKALTELKGPIIQVNGLGSFTAKPKEVPKLVIKYQKHLEVLNPETFNQMATMKDVEEKLSKARQLLDQMDAEKARKIEFLKNKRNAQDNMEK